MNNIRNKPPSLRLNVYGDNNSITFSEGCSDIRGTMDIGLMECPADNCTVAIGKSQFSGPIDVRIYESGTKFTIGDDCLFSECISIWASDSHSIFGSDGKITNIGRFVDIGNHCWICKDSTILKNTAIPEGCVVGCNSVVTSASCHGLTSNCILCGNPAKCVKRGMTWSSERPNRFNETGS